MLQPHINHSFPADLSELSRKTPAKLLEPVLLSAIPTIPEVLGTDSFLFATSIDSLNDIDSKSVYARTIFASAIADPREMEILPSDDVGPMKGGGGPSTHKHGGDLQATKGPPPLGGTEPRESAKLEVSEATKHAIMAQLACLPAGVTAMDLLRELRRESKSDQPRHTLNTDNYVPSLVQHPFIPPPTAESAAAALGDLLRLLWPPRKTGAGYKDPRLDLLLRRRMEGMRRFLKYYTNPKRAIGWIAASVEAATVYAGQGPWLAHRLRAWTQAFIADRSKLPFNVYGSWNTSVVDDESFKLELLLHLQGIGKYVSAKDIVDYVAKPDVQESLGITKPITISTSQRWMHTLGYRWAKSPSGQYVDGHERADVVAYRQKVFLPALAELLPRMREYSSEGIECAGPLQSPRRTVIWNHDESTFYAHDRRRIRWVHEGETEQYSHIG